LAIDISIVVPFHAEGRVIPRTLNALIRSADFARRNGLSIEVIAVLDRVTDKISREILDRLKQPEGLTISKHEVDFGALSLSRNFGISKADGEYVSILDGDDLYSKEWLYRAYRACASNPNRIAHPEFLYLFPIEPYLKSYESGPHVLLNLLIGNQWSALSFARRDIFERIPYVLDTDVYAFQDWLWNCHTAEKGYEHVLVPGTLMAIRQSPPGKSLWQGSYRNNKVVRPNAFFRKIFLKEFPGLFKNDATGESGGKTTARLFRTAVDHIRPLMDYLYEERPRLHGAIIDFKRSLAHTLRMIRNPQTVPSWVRKELDALSRIEPSLEYTSKIRTRTPIHFPIAESITPEISQLVGNPGAPVFILDRLEWGDTLQKALCYMHAVEKPVYVLTTERSRKQQPDLLTKGSVHIDVAGMPLVQEDRIKFLHRLLLEAKPSFIHIIRSPLAYEMMNRYHATFENVRVVASIFSLDDAHEPDFIGWELRRYPDLVDHLSCIATDSFFFRARILDVFGSATAPVVHHRLPFCMGYHRNSGKIHRQEVYPQSRDILNNTRIRILFVGRKERGWKRRWARGHAPSTARHQLPSFHFLETLPMKTVSSANLSGLNPRGPTTAHDIDFASFHLLALQSDASAALCLLLQAMGNGIPVVARRSALSEELVGEGRGWLIEKTGNSDDLIGAVLDCLQYPERLKEKGEAAREFVTRKHHWDLFRRQVEEFYGGERTQHALSAKTRGRS